MGLFNTMLISASGLTAERLRMDLIANNLANVETTRTADGGPYRRKVAILESREAPSFQTALSRALQAQGAERSRQPVGAGVRVVGIAEDRRPFKLQYDPTHPDANAEGYVQLPNVDVVTEMVDLISASRAYEANVTALNAAKAMALKALEIGR